MQRFRILCFPALARWRAWCVAFAVGVAAFSSGPACATVFSFNTTALAGTSARLEFSLFDGDFDLGNNIVTIASVNTNGSLGAFDCTLGCTGGPPFAITEAAGLGQYLQDLTLGTVFSFDLSFTTNFSGVNAPDRLVLSLLDAGTNFTLVDTDLDFLSDAVPAQDAILVVDLVPGSTPQLPTASNPPLPGAIPAPGTAALIGIGLVLLATRRTRTPVPAV
jgi:hypothetical protein